jgi:DNA-binding winged helix-turn-helix (wHTH) protein
MLVGLEHWNGEEVERKPVMHIAGRSLHNQHSKVRVTSQEIECLNYTTVRNSKNPNITSVTCNL